MASSFIYPPEFTCQRCNKPYECAVKNTKTDEIACRGCVGELTSDWWHHDPINMQMERIRVQQSEHIGPDWENEVTLSHVINGDWERVRADLKSNPLRTWNNMSKYILVEACEHSDCPRDVIIALLDSGVNPNVPRPCLNPCSPFAHNVCFVAAEKECLEALYVFMERGIYWYFPECGPVSIAAEKGNADVLDYLWSVTSRGGYHDMTVKESTSVPITR